MPRRRTGCGGRGIEADPAGQLGGEVHLAPLGVARRAQEIAEARLECFDEAGDLAVALGARLPGIDGHHGAHGQRFHRGAGGDQRRVVRRGEGAGQVGFQHRRRGGQREELQPRAGLDVGEKPRGLAGDEGQRLDLAAAQLLQRGVLRVVGEAWRDAQPLEDQAGGHRGAAGGKVYVDRLAGQIPHRADVVAGQDVDFLVIQLRDVLDHVLDAGQAAAAARDGERVGLDDPDIDAAQQDDVLDVLQRALADDRQDAQLRPVSTAARSAAMRT
jgi:hypothetical protein